MIDVRELRIGNYVYLFKSTALYKITEIGYSEIEVDRYEASGISSEAVFRTYVENLNPIPLTEELSLKCGLEPHYFGIKTYYNPLLELDHDFKLMGVDYNIQVRYLHQLQNLYFDLGGKELEVNL
jgi:hypothetical protein|nr:MAG TPA: hypothetical protein [Caudoviricetes sp.]